MQAIIGEVFPVINSRLPPRARGWLGEGKSGESQGKICSEVIAVAEKACCRIISATMVGF